MGGGEGLLLSLLKCPFPVSLLQVLGQHPFERVADSFFDMIPWECDLRRVIRFSHALAIE